MQIAICDLALRVERAGGQRWRAAIDSHLIQEQAVAPARGGGSGDSPERTRRDHANRDRGL